MGFPPFLVDLELPEEVPGVLGAPFVQVLDEVLGGDSMTNRVNRRGAGRRSVGEFFLFNFKPNFVRSILQAAQATLVFAEDQHVVVAFAVVDDAVAEARRANALVIHGVSFGAMNTV